MISNKAIFFLGVSMVLSMVIFSGYQYIYEANFNVVSRDKEKTTPPILYCIEKGTDFKTLLKDLKGKDIVHEPLSFAFLSKLMKYQENVKPGCYKFPANMTNVQAIRLLRAGDQEEVKLTFTHARYIEDLAPQLTKHSVADSTTMLRMLEDPTTSIKYGFNEATFIAMFIPNTYRVYWTDEEEDILERVKKEYDSFWTTKRKNLAKEQGLTPLQVSILASIVQNESLAKEEQPTIAGLYLNRLNRGIKLEADPTVKFSLGDFSIKRVLNKHLEHDSPYNTYKYEGLPPGPISMPDISSIEAVLMPEKNDYLFMCSKGDGSELHNFAKTNAQHNRNRIIYANNLKKRGKR